MRIATHNSGTGEDGHGWWSFILEPFTKCQSKTLTEQYQIGVRLFDIRVKCVKGEWYLAHGLWRSDKPVGYALSDLNLSGYKTQEKATLMVTYEGECSDKSSFVSEINTWEMYSWLDIAEVNIRKPKWRCLRRMKNVRFSLNFRILDGSTWHTLLPIPWLWAKLEPHPNIYDSKNFKPGDYIMVDFV